MKLVEAWLEERDGRSGYGVKHENGYISWSPKEIFESAYFPMGDDNIRVSEEMVNKFLGKTSSAKLDDKTTIVRAETLTDFLQYEVSSCVDPENYNHEMGVRIAGARIKDTLGSALGLFFSGVGSD